MSIVAFKADQDIIFRSLIKEAMLLDQQRDQILWRQDGTARELSETEKAKLSELQAWSTKLIAKVQQLKGLI